MWRARFGSPCRTGGAGREPPPGTRPGRRRPQGWLPAPRSDSSELRSLLSSDVRRDPFDEQVVRVLRPLERAEVPVGDDELVDPGLAVTDDRLDDLVGATD